MEKKTTITVELTKEQGGGLIAALASAILFTKSGMVKAKVPYATAEALAETLNQLLDLQLYPDDMAESVQLARELPGMLNAKKQVVH